jgi:hypothetical protein
MDHAEVRGWLAEAFFRPGALRRLEESEAGDPTLDPLREHLAGCAACTRELRSLRATGVALDVGFGPSPATEQRVLERVRHLGRQRPSETAPEARPWFARLSPLGLAAALLVVLLAFGAGALLGLAWPAEEPEEGPRLTNAVSVMGQLLRAPDARQLWLADSEATPAGLVVHSPSQRRLAVIATGFEQPVPGRYDCYLERGEERTLIGPMHFEGDTGFWAGPMEQPVDAGRAGDRFVVLEEEDGQPLLSGEFR